MVEGIGKEGTGDRDEKNGMRRMKLGKRNEEEWNNSLDEVLKGTKKKEKTRRKMDEKKKRRGER